MEGWNLKCLNAVTATVMFLGIILFCPGFINGQEKLPEGEVIKYVGKNETTLLMTVKISNKYKPGYQPSINNLIFWEYGKNPERHSFEIREKYQEVKDSFNEYLIKIGLPGGDFKFAEIIARSGFFPVAGSFIVPIYTPITIPSNKVIYLGNLEANVVERTADDQMRAGPVLPLLDQAVTGASGGTFEIIISDNLETDLPKFIKKYPSLREAAIEKRVLEPWKKPQESDMEPPLFSKQPFGS